MNAQGRKSSLAVFGSSARGDIDAYSDWDLFIVADDESTLGELKDKYSSMGWSCTAYTWSRLQRAADQGSLFVQHLKQESRILSDPSDRLAHLFDQYATKANYKLEFEGAASLVGNLIENLPQCDMGPMWTLDVLCVGFRSLAVSILADEGIYKFSNSGIIEGLIRIGMISREDEFYLHDLRRFKSIYRRGAIDKRIGWSDTVDRVRLIDRTFALGLSTKFVHTVDVIDLALASGVTAYADSNWYTRCRRVESALWMLEPRHNLECAEFLMQRQSLFRIVKSPNTYAWHFTGGYQSVQGKLSDLVEICAV